MGDGSADCFSDFLTGIAYYFAGLLTGLRQARWYASRSFGLGLAIAMTYRWRVHLPILAMFAGFDWLCDCDSGGGGLGRLPERRLLSRPARWPGGWQLTAGVTAGCAACLYVGMGLLFALVLNPLLQSFIQSSAIIK
jgi:hypothetical protein